MGKLNTDISPKKKKKLKITVPVIRYWILAERNMNQ